MAVRLNGYSSSHGQASLGAGEQGRAPDAAAADGRIAVCALGTPLPARPTEAAPAQARPARCLRGMGRVGTLLRVPEILAAPIQHSANGADALHACIIPGVESTGGETDIASAL